MTASPEAQNQIYVGTIVDTPVLGELRIRHEQALGVDAAGFIRFIVPTESLQKTLDVHDLFRANTKTYHLETHGTTFLFPGFIDTHTHASQYPNTGIFGSSTLLSWLETYTFPMESSFSDLARAKRVYSRVVDRTLANGTTCAAYYATLHVPATKLLADICLQKGQRALVGRVCMDRMSPEGYRDESGEAAVAATEEVIKYCHEIDPKASIIRPIITPRFAPSCTGECMAALGRLQVETGAWCQTHISENKAELDLVKKLFPQSEDYVSVYNEAGLLGEKMILAHAIHLSTKEVRTISQTKTKVSHCPASNTAITSGAAKVKSMMKEGIVVSLGTDMSGGYSPSILEMAKQAMLVSRHVAMENGDDHKLSVEEALYLATMAGAHSVGLGDSIGSFEVGKDFDAQMVNLNNVGDEGECHESFGQADCFGWESWPDRVAEWLWTGDDRNVCAVWIRGRQVHTSSRFKSGLADLNEQDGMSEK